MTAATAETVTPIAGQRPAPASTKSLVVRIAERYGVDADKLMTTLKATAFRQRADKKTGEMREPTNEEMMALLIIADQYRLNPFTKELYAYFDPKSGAIIPIVSIDGWLRIINEQPSLRSLSFVYSDDVVKHNGKTCHVWMECEIVRADRDKPVVIREYFDEVVRKVDLATPWDTHPNRMHRHKVTIQAGRYAFGFGGIYDEDEAARIIEGTSARMDDAAPGVQAINAAVIGKTLEHKTTEQLAPTVVGKAGEHVAANGSGKQEATKTAAPTPPTWQEVVEAIDSAKSEDALVIAGDLIRSLTDPNERDSAQVHFDQRVAALRAQGDA